MSSLRLSGPSAARPTPTRQPLAATRPALAQSTLSLGASSSRHSGGGGAGSAPPLLPTARERRAAVERLDPELLNELKEAFQLFDGDEDGLIDPRELKAAFKALGVDVRMADVRRMLADAGRNEDVGVDFDTFLELIAALLPDRNSPEEIAKVFALFDESGQGRIGLRELRRVVAELGEEIGDEELREMVAEADRDGDGSVTLEDFMRVVRRQGDPWASDGDDDER